MATPAGAPTTSLSTRSIAAAADTDTDDEGFDELCLLPSHHNSNSDSTNNNKSEQSPSYSENSWKSTHGLPPTSVSFATWSEIERAEFAFALLQTLSAPLLGSISRRIQPLLARDFIARLPLEIAAHILSYTNPRTLVRVARVSSEWRAVAYDNSVWHSLYVGKGWKISDNYLNERVRWSNDVERRRLRKESRRAHGRKKKDDLMDEFQNVKICDSAGDHIGVARTYSNTRSTSSSSSSSSDSETDHEEPAASTTALAAEQPSSTSLLKPRSSLSSLIDRGTIPSPFGRPQSRLSTASHFSHTSSSTPLIPWREIYHQRHNLAQNWLHNRCSTTVFQGHTEAVYCLQFDSRKIVSGSRDKTLKIWDTRSGHCKATLRGHTGSVLCLQYNENIIVSGSSDWSMIVWDVRSGRMLRTMTGHMESVLNLRFDEKWVVSCSKDTTVKVWDLESGKLVRTMVGHRAAVNAVQMKGRVVVSASGDRSIKLWDLHTGAHLKTLLGHTRGIACIQFDGDLIVSGSSDSTIKLWSAPTGTLLRTIDGHTSLVRTLQFDDTRIVSGSYDETIKVWDLKTGELLLDLCGGGNLGATRMGVEGAGGITTVGAAATNVGTTPTRAHSGRVFKLAFDETRIVSCSQDQTIIVWDFAKGVDSRYFV
ncbi:WD40-repeat-containing domain protein [Fimicolochytrium jonesii]|uniref:WD40-repeat-containing domain protein n=1 Tax=Fimicolochytrium jonesii TaxID=1396493 RepID=UPI0022FF0C4B|nr:WD40-repeat-containing domain protein [Fimicolochytrium jonesii]KAI8826785.1 WD40-repeat-containing domain protein [Fimicolochytrium jonesii]